MLNSFKSNPFIKRTFFILPVIFFLFLASLIPFLKFWGQKNEELSPSASANSPFEYVKSQTALEEAGSPEESANPYWWVDSGAKLIIEPGRGRTIQGPLPENDYWREIYKKSNPEDTEEGRYPQNIFRLITRSLWQNHTSQGYFKITAINLAKSTNRNESNGILLMGRYRDKDNFYYAGVRVDGRAVIKKKSAGVYHTVAIAPAYGKYDYDSVKRYNALPLGTWIGLKTEIINLDDGKVSIKLFLDKDRSGVWELALEAVDDGRLYGGKAILDKASSGIRTDFMDVEFEDYRVDNI